MLRGRPWMPAAAVLLIVPGAFGEPGAGTNAFPASDPLGRAVEVSTNQLQSPLSPAGAGGVARQIPAAPRGAAQTAEQRRRLREARTGREWFPETPPVLMPYLANLDEYGNTAVQPGAAMTNDPVVKGVQAAKYDLSEAGLRYGLYQSFTLVSLSGAAQGASALQYYTATWVGKWAVTQVPDAGRAGWVSTEINVQQGLSVASRSQTVQENAGSVVNPQATVFGPNGIWISELAWQQSFLDGKLVVVAGEVDQSNYLDANAYANNSQGQFLNSAFVNSGVLPLPFNNLGLNLQYQPSEWGYVMLGTGALNVGPGSSPFDHLGFRNWAWLLEAGWTPSDLAGLGPGAYRLQPFVATVEGTTQGGLGLNCQQQLGTNSPFAWFGRFGFGGTWITADGASVQSATGLVVQGPLAAAGWVPKLSNDFLGAAFVWTRPSKAFGPAYHSNEYGFEGTYALQLTPLVSVQPDLQVLWNPAANPVADRTVVFQMQFNMLW
ncbi:MAG: carbohydrate porin [Verrucomicrobiota bacterium]